MWWYAGTIFATDAPQSVAQTSDAEIRQAIIRDSVAKYLQTGYPCACPYDLMRNGRPWAMSAPTSGPRCLASVLPVSDGMVADWRRAHP